MTTDEKIILDNLMERTLVHIAWNGQCEQENLFSEYLLSKQNEQLFKFSEIYNSFYNKKSELFTTHELDIMKYSVEAILDLLIKYSQAIYKRYSNISKINHVMYDHFAIRFWSKPENEKKLVVLAPDLWFP